MLAQREPAYTCGMTAPHPQAPHRPAERADRPTRAARWPRALCARWGRVLLTVALLAGAANPLASLAAERGPRARPALPAAADEAQVIVKFKSTSKSILSAGRDADRVVLKQAVTLGARTGLALRDGVMAGPRLQVLHASGLSSAALAARLAADGEVEYAVPNGRKRSHAAPSDPYFFGKQAATTANGLYVAGINAASAWSVSQGNAAVVVAVLDTGVRPEHPDLRGKLLPGYDFVADTTISNDGDGRDADPSDPGDWVTAAESSSGPAKLLGCGQSDSSWHGTQTTGLITASANNGIGIAGMGRNVRVLPVRVLGKCSGDDADIIAGMYWAAGIAYGDQYGDIPTNPNPAQIISMSLGSNDSCGQAYQDAINAIRAKGVIVVASPATTVWPSMHRPIAAAWWRSAACATSVPRMGMPAWARKSRSALRPETASPSPAPASIRSSAAATPAARYRNPPNTPAPAPTPVSVPVLPHRWWPPPWR